MYRENRTNEILISTQGIYWDGCEDLFEDLWCCSIAKERDSVPESTLFSDPQVSILLSRVDYRNLVHSSCQILIELTREKKKQTFLSFGHILRVRSH